MNQTNHLSEVKKKFDNTSAYIQGNSTIQARVALANNLTKNIKYDSILDIGCGDGSIGLNLLKQSGKLHLVDISERMIQVAQANAEEGMVSPDAVEYSVADVLDFKANEQADLVICMGVVAHVKDIPALIERIDNNLKKGGFLLIQFTERLSLQGWLLYNLFSHGSGTYQVNHTSARELFGMLRSKNIIPVAKKRYSAFSFGVSKINKRWAENFKIGSSRLPLIRNLFSERILLCQKGED